MRFYEQIEVCFVEIEKYFGEKSLQEFLACNYSNLYLYHFELGIWVRNGLLQENSKLYQCFIDGNVLQKDEMSTLLTQLFYIYKQTGSGVFDN